MQIYAKTKPHVKHTAAKSVASFEQSLSMTQITSLKLSFTSHDKITCTSLQLPLTSNNRNNMVQIGNGQEKAQSERNCHSKNRGGKKIN